MFHSSRPFLRATCALLLAACSDGSPTAPSPGAARPSLSETIIGEEPSSEELAQMPAEFETAPGVYSHWTDVGFITAEQKAYARAYMTYFASDGRQKVTLSVGLNDRLVGSSTAEEAQSDWLPDVRMMFTSTTRSVSAACGHTADGQSQHIAFHKFLVDGWKFLSWGHHEVPSSDSDAQEPCPPPPPPTDEEEVPGEEPYLEECEVCQQWFWRVPGGGSLEWWECTPEEGDACQSGVS